MTTNQRLEETSGAVRRLLTAAVGFVIAALGLTLAAGPAAVQNRVGAQPVFSILTVGPHDAAAQASTGVRGPPQLRLVSATGVAAETAPRFSVGGNGVTTDLSRPAFNDLYDSVGAMDFSTGRNQAVFYSGPAQRAAATRFATENGASTIEMTPGGSYLDKLNLFGEGSPLAQAEAGAVWGQASRQFAGGASGSVFGFVQGARAEGIFNTIEWPTLLDNPNVINVITGGL